MPPIGREALGAGNNARALELQCATLLVYAGRAVCLDQYAVGAVGRVEC